MAERLNADLFEVLISQIGKDGKINIVVGKTLRVLGHAELFEPVRDLLHRRLRADLPNSSEPRAYQPSPQS